MARIKVKPHTRNKGKIKVKSYTRKKRPKGKKKIQDKTNYVLVRDEFGRVLGFKKKRKRKRK